MTAFAAAETRVALRNALDLVIRDRLVALEVEIGAALAASGPPPDDDDELDDLPPDPTSPWRRVSLEEILFMAQGRLDALRDAVLEVFELRA